MGKTHYSGISVGDVSTGSFGGAMLCQSYRFPSGSPDRQIYFNESSLIRDVFFTDDTGVGFAADIKFGTSQGGSQLFTGTALATAPLAVLKKMQGPVWINTTSANVTVWITYATAG